MLLSPTEIQARERSEQKKLNEVWAYTIKERDRWACVICGSTFKPNAHHIIPREHKDFITNMDNGITLCTNHHKFSRFISAHNNPLAFFLWLERFQPHLFLLAKERTKAFLKGEGIVL